MVGVGVVVRLKQGAELHIAQLMPLPLTVSCFRRIQIGFTLLIPAHLGSPGQRAVKQVCVFHRSKFTATGKNVAEVIGVTLCDKLSSIFWKT